MTKIWFENLVANCTKVAINKQWSMIDNKIDKKFYIFIQLYVLYSHNKICLTIFSYLFD